jgi:TonB-linked SusC/RagA family outer membrane protein
MKTKFSGILTLFLAFVVQLSFAQEKTVSGVVSDENGLPLPSATVAVKGTSNGTTTDFDGNYSISTSTGDVLTYSYVGYSTKEVTVGASNKIDVTLEPDNTLDEVIVVGYGTTTERANTGTAKVVKSEVLEAKNFANVTQALTGEVAGVNVINTSGQPGTVGTIRIRGFGSPNGNRAPLYVVDGVPLQGTFALNTINPSDIKSTTVLKDATATAIYGSRGANGVVIITTKSGTSTDKSYIEVDLKTGINNQIIPRYDVIDSPEQYVGLVWEGLYNRGVVEGNPDPVGFANTRLLGDNGIGAGYNMWDVATGGELIDPVTRSVRPGVNRLFTPESYADESFGTGIRTEANLRMGGGSDKSRYYVSLGYLNDEGYIINSDYKRYTGLINLSTDIKDWLKVGANVNYAYSESTNNGQTDGSENIFEFADKMAPIYPVYARFPGTGQLIPDPIYGGAQFDFGSPTALANGFDRARPNANLLNPVGSAILDFNGGDNHALNGNFTTDINITKDLKAEIRYGAQYRFQRFYNVGNNNYTIAANSNGTLTVTDSQLWNTSFLQLLRYNKTFGNHSIEALVAHESNEQRSDVSQQFKQNVYQPGIYNLSNYAESTSPAIGTTSGSAIESYFGQVNYNYNGKYYLTGSLRTDGSSRFVNDKWGVFGSIGGAWVMSAEDFMADSYISYLKLKGSYGITGDQDGVSNVSGYTIYSREFVGGAISLPETRPGNPDLTWETSKMTQFGIESTIGRSRFLDVNIDYYNKYTDNLFFPQRRGPSIGFASILVNDGEISNSGLEFDVTAHIIKNKDFQLDISANGEIISNEFKTMPIDVSTGQEKILDVQGLYAWSKGSSIYDFYMREWAGVDPADGSPLWYQYYDDLNNNGVLDAGEPTSTDNFYIGNGTEESLNGTGSLFEYQQKVGNANIKKTVTKTYANATEVYLDKSFIPDLRGAFRLSGAFKNFDFSAQFTYSLGGYAYDSQYAELMSDRFGAAGNNYSTDILNRWQQPGDITDVPLLSDNAVVNGTSTSSRFIISTDYIALNNARIGYTVPNKLISKSGIDALNLWVSGDNLMIKTKREGFNPSIRENGNSGRQIYAPATTITFGARIKF